MMLPVQARLRPRLLGALAFAMAVRSSTAKMQERAAQEDESAVVVLVVTLVASVASLAAIVVELTGIHNDQTGQQAFRLSIAAITILCSWFLVHTIYAIRYAHEYYGDGGERRGSPSRTRDAPITGISCISRSISGRRRRPPTW